MRIFSDVHGGTEPLNALSRSDGPVLILGDLVNLIDYRSWSGILPDVCGADFVMAMSELRIAGNFSELKTRWSELRDGREDELDAAFNTAYEAAYSEVGAALKGLEGYVTFGNVDRVDLLEACLPDGLVFVSAGTVELDGYTIGIVGGGTRRTGAPGEIVDDEMKDRLGTLGPVDILCTHVPPLVPALATDVVAGPGKGSEAVLNYIQDHQPRFHYFGDVHQPRAVTWDIGGTRCHNVGFFRATGRTVTHGRS